MPPTTRTFVAIPLPPPVGESLVRLQEALRPKLPGVRWATTPPFHITLAFLGDVADAELAAVSQAVSTACAPFAPFELHLEGLGVFPDLRRPRVLWAGVTVPEDSPLARLQTAVAAAVSRVGYPPDSERFSPHVTLGRFKPERGRSAPPSLAAILDSNQAWSGGTFTAWEVTTFASTRGPEGPTYSPLGVAPLLGPRATAPP